MPRYLPSLSTLISLDSLPESLGFFKDAAADVFDDIYIDHYQALASRYGEDKSFNLDIVLNKEVGVELPGTGFSLLLNPSIDATAPGQTIFNVSLYYRFGVLRFIKNFSLANFSFSINDLIKVLFNGSGYLPADLLAQASLNMENPLENSGGYLIYDIKELVDFFNSYYDLSGTPNEIIYTVGTTYEDIETGLANAGITTDDVIAEFNIGTDYPSGGDTLEDVYSRIGFEKYTGPLSISNLVDRLNSDYSLIGTPNEIVYTDSTTYDDIVTALDQAGISILNILADYVAIGDNFDDIESSLITFFAGVSSKTSGVEFTGLFDPFIRFSINDLNLAIRFPRSVLSPIDPTTNLPYTDESILSMLRFSVGNLTFSSTDAFTFDNENSITFDKSEIGNTGLVLSFTGVKLDLSTTTNIPEAAAAGYPTDFVGAYAKSASIEFIKFGSDDPDHPSASLTATNFLIGTGGVSGTISLDTGGSLYRMFGEFAAELDTFSITFRQNTIINCDIKGKLALPPNFSQDGSPVVLLIDVAIKDAGDFSVTATPQDTLPSFTFPNVFTLTVRSLSLGEKGGRFYVQMAGVLDFIADIPVLGAVLPKGIIINKLIIWDNGDIEFEGGGLVVPQAFKLSVGPVQLEVDHLSLSSYSRKLNGVDRNYYCIGFDGMVNAGTAGLSAEGDGIKYYFTHDDGPGKPFDSFVSIDGIAIEITIPQGASEDDATVILQGYLSMKNPDPAISGSTAGEEYTGKITVDIPKLHITGSAAMRLQPSVPAFLVDMGLDLSTPIPLGGTGLGIYGFRGLIGQHYVPSKSATTPPLPDTATWWDYYKAKSTLTHHEGVEIDKFASKSGFSVGAGVSIATEFDSGYIFSSKLFMILGLPDVFVIYGQAAIIRKRLGLLDDTDPPFTAFIVIGDNSFQGKLNVDYNLPDSGSFKGAILSLKAELDLAFFFNNASGWYINVGKDTPASAQVQASVLTLFKGHAYLMISTQGIKVGAGVSFDFNKSFGPVGVSLGAFLNIGGFISFKPVQVGGFIQVGGYAGIKVFGARLSIYVAMALAVEAPNPFNIVGSIQLKVKIVFIKIGFKLDMSWHLGGDPSVLRAPVDILSLPDPGIGYMPFSATNILTNEIFPVNYVIVDNLTTPPPPGDPNWKYDFTNAVDVENVVIPIDSFVDIELLKPVLPGNVSIGGANNQLPDGYTELLPPKKGVSAQVKHQYELAGLDIYAWNESSSGGAWVAYNIYEAVTAIVEANVGPDAIDLTTLKAGYWQFTEKNKYNKIRLMSQNMFSYLTSSTNTQSNLNAQHYNVGDIFCYHNIQQTVTINWKAETEGSIYPENTPVFFQGLTFTFNGVETIIEEEASFSGLSLKMDGGAGTVTIGFPEQISNLSLQFGDNTNNVAIGFIQLSYTVDDAAQAVPIANVVSTAGITSSQQGVVITYDNIGVPIDQIKLQFNTPALPDYKGDLNIGGHYQLPDQFVTGILDGNNEISKSLMYTALYNQSYTAAEVRAMNYTGQSGTVAQWPMDSNAASVGGLNGITSGLPGEVSGFYGIESGTLNNHQVYSFGANADSLIVPYDPMLKVENASFSFETTAIFYPYNAGISTLLSKVYEDASSGYKKGFALHLIQDTPADAGVSYTAGTLPHFKVLLTCYNGDAVSGITVTDSYTFDCSISRVKPYQYKRIFVSVDRVANKLDIYIDKVQKISTAIPNELNNEVPVDAYTYLNQLTFITLASQTRLTDTQSSEAALINEVQILNDALNKTIQPIWRPNTTFAIKVTTQDKVGNSTAIPKVHILGFKTAGPLGHFHQESAIYQKLVTEDQANSFKLATLQFYIDYNRSFPDAQSRYNLSKPVLYSNPQVKLYFTQPYMNAMYANWDSYQGMPAVDSSLQLQLVDSSGTAVTQQLVWAPIQETSIDITNYKSLPRDQQALFLFNYVASQETCNPMPSPIVKRLKQGYYQFPDLEPNKLYTALFNAIYQPDGSSADSYEVYKYNFMTSRYADFASQAGSFILNSTPGSERYAIYVTNVSFSSDYITGTLIPLTNDDPTDDPSFVLQYAVPYERMVYGGLKLPAPESFEYTVIQLIVNTDPVDSSKQLLGILVYNPEPFNDPKYTSDLLADTVQLTVKHGSITDTDFIYLHAGDTSAVFITNATMNVSVGSITLQFLYKLFNGVEYIVDQEYSNDTPIDITPYING